MTIDLSKLAEPFPQEDIEYRVSRSGKGNNGIWCNVLAYITARAIQQILDDVCGPENWRNEPMTTHEIRPGVVAVQVGISIRVGDEWVTKYDVAEPTNIEAAKGGFSGAMKRAGAQWGIGRYLYHLDETFTETSEDKERRKHGWKYAKLSEKAGGNVYYWKPPQLPAWALPKCEDEAEVSTKELNGLKRAWKSKFAPESSNRAEQVEGFSRFVVSIVGEFPSADHTTWTRDALDKCQSRINETIDPAGVSADVPFGE